MMETWNTNELLKGVEIKKGREWGSVLLFRRLFTAC